VEESSRRLLGAAGIDPASVTERSGGSGTAVLTWPGRAAKHYRPGFDDYSGLGPVATAEKVVAAARHLPELGVPVPAVIDVLRTADEALVISEAVPAAPFTWAHRLEAARVLRRLHDIEPASLAEDLRLPVLRSRRNAGRIRIGVERSAAVLDGADPGWRAGPVGIRVLSLLAAGEPEPGDRLVHGDYFSVNLLADGDGVLVIDWDLLSRGDPMWDLAFLVGADPGLPTLVVEQVLDAYGRHRIDSAALEWHMECWSLFWLLRHLAAARRQPAGGTPIG